MFYICTNEDKNYINKKVKPGNGCPGAQVCAANKCG